VWTIRGGAGRATKMAPGVDKQKPDTLRIPCASKIGNKDSRKLIDRF